MRWDAWIGIGGVAVLTSAAIGVCACERDDATRRRPSTSATIAMGLGVIRREPSIASGRIPLEQERGIGREHARERLVQAEGDAGVA